MFTTPQRKIKTNVNLIIDNLSIECVKNVKFLGVYIDENLSWSKH